MPIIDIILILDIVFLLLAGLLFLAGWFMGPVVARRLALPIKVLLVLALLSYIGTEMGIGHGDNLIWGIVLVVALVVIWYLTSRQKRSN